MASKFKFSVDVFPSRLQQAIDDPAGGPASFTRSLAERIHQAARLLIAPKGFSGHHRTRQQARPELLRDSGSVVKTGKGNAFAVVFDSDSALVHHNGAKRHFMAAKDKESKPNVYARRGPGAYTFGPTRGPIDHPGSDANPYLTKAAQQLGLSTRGGGNRLGRARGQGGRFTKMFF